MKTDLPLLLASASPRRSALLQTAHIPFTAVPSDAREVEPNTLPASETVLENARRKASEVSSRFPHRLVLGADTLVCADGTALGKPTDRQHARRMLQFLSGRSHTVLTGVCLTDGVRVRSALSETEVVFRTLPDELIERYLSTGECDDKAGAYGIQGMGGLFVEKLIGDYYGVVGLPICLVQRLLEEWDGKQP